MSTSAELSDEYTNWIELMAKRSQQGADAVLESQTAPKWFMPDEPLDPVEDLEDIHTGFTRSTVNSKAEEALSGQNESASVGDYLVLQLEASELSAAERAFRLRHATRVRLAIHAAARKRSNSLPGGNWIRAHRETLQNYQNLAKA